MEIVNLIFDWLFLELEINNALTQLANKETYLYLKNLRIN